MIYCNVHLLELARSPSSEGGIFIFLSGLKLNREEIITKFPLEKGIYLNIIGLSYSEITPFDMICVNLKVTFAIVRLIDLGWKSNFSVWGQIDNGNFKASFYNCNSNSILLNYSPFLFENVYVPPWPFNVSSIVKWGTLACVWTFGSFTNFGNDCESWKLFVAR